MGVETVAYTLKWTKRQKYVLPPVSRAGLDILGERGAKPPPPKPPNPLMESVAA
jgi:hypothetical protein